MAGVPARQRDHARDPVRVQRRRRRGVELPHDEDRGRTLGRDGVLGRAGSGQCGEHPLPHAADVLGARPQVGVVHRLELSAQRGEPVLPRRGRGRAGGDAGGDRLDQAGVDEQGLVGLEDGAHRAGAPGGGTAQCGQLGECAGDGRVRAPLLLGRPARPVAGEVDRAAPHHRRAEGDVAARSGGGRHGHDRRTGRPGGRRGRLVGGPVAPGVRGQRPHRLGQRLGAGSGRLEAQPVALPDGERHEPGEAAGVDRTAARAQVRDHGGRVGGPHEPDQPGGRARVQAVRGVHGQLGDDLGCRGRRRRARRRRVRRLPQVIQLGGQSAAGLLEHRVQRRAGRGRHHGGDQPLDERSGRQAHPLGDVGRHELPRHLRAEHGAAEVEEHQHAVR